MVIIDSTVLSNFLILVFLFNYIFIIFILMSISFRLGERLVSRVF